MEGEEENESEGHNGSAGCGCPPDKGGGPFRPTISIVTESLDDEEAVVAEAQSRQSHSTVAAHSCSSASSVPMWATHLVTEAPTWHTPKPSAQRKKIFSGKDEQGSAANAPAAGMRRSVKSSASLVDESSGGGPPTSWLAGLRKAQQQQQQHQPSLGHKVHSEPSLDERGRLGTAALRLFRMTDSIANRAFAPQGSSTRPPSVANEEDSTSYNSASPPACSSTRSQPCNWWSSPTRAGHTIKRATSLESELSSAPRAGVYRGVADASATHLRDFLVAKEGKLLIAMVGLPARGKSYIAQGIKRHFDWLGFQTELFNAGNYRRKLLAAEASKDASLFDPENPQGVRMRNELAALALDDALKCLKETECCLAIFDATNTTTARRAWLSSELATRGGGWVRLVFLETVLTDDMAWYNVKESKLNSPDYEGWSPDAIMRDFYRRIELYKKAYEPCTAADGSFIRVTNAGDELLVHRCPGYTLGRVSWLVNSMRLTLRPILLARTGESTYDLDGRLGGDPPLTPVGQLFASKLRTTMLHWLESEPIANSCCASKAVVWTSTHIRALQTVSGLASQAFPVLQMQMLDEMKFGLCSGRTHEDFEADFPEIAEARRRDKLRTRFPEGESYMDVFMRLEPLLLDLLAQSQPVVIVSHLGVLRVLYGYLMGYSPSECPMLDIPMHCVLQLNPSGYGFAERRHYPL